MENSIFMKVEDVAVAMGVSKSYAYKIVQKLNQELREKGYITISGRVNRHVTDTRIGRETGSNLPSEDLPPSGKHRRGNANSRTRAKRTWI